METRTTNSLTHPILFTSMVFSLGQLLYISVLLVNSVAILHEDRFLARIGWTTKYEQFGPDGPSITARISSLVHAVRTLLRIPLIGVNLMIIIYELLLG